MMDGFVFGGRQEEFVSKKTNERNYSHSSYETKRMCFLDECVDVEYWTKNHGISIDYHIDDSTRRYIPDFLIHWRNGKTSLEEVKGWVRDKRTFEAKNAAAIEFTQSRDMEFRVLFFDDLESV